MKLLPGRMQVLGWLPDALVSVRGDDRGRALYLTFDDGPHGGCTPALLDLLRAYRACASFFLVGRNVERHPELVQRMVDEGHRLGNHSYTHPQFGRLSLAQQLEEIDVTDRLLARFDGVRRHRFRPPRGVFSLGLTAHFAARRRNLTYWSYNSMDYQRGDPVEFIARMRAAPPKAGEVILMHDDGDCAIRMLETLLGEWQAAGFQFCALPHARQTHAAPEQDVAVRSANPG
ncbi:Peptidoglycan/xylan/chitin deacetylase, PgdA/CDA1 family [Pseudoxanthomonas sp. GM95]|uniref:polysaccharide deacetylase family protein n=1 Tax=Pseudoxanthomonas sp. GM95 TaxID=1881043 RepID=UPI0008B88042|nr:polysaccharide deacetylase family protein [Pseudoxanthomonas sp. GM95]SEL09512.1 Peptidoglycan/xylan/chitin deacetylase, PgdA/CDA1 family [Pseudoxanthomonas sp. GM95]